MSRIGNMVIEIAAGVNVDIKEGNLVTVTGPKGTLTKQFCPELSLVMENNTITVKRPNEEKRIKQLHGTTRALLANMITGVSTGFKIELQIEGIGYRASLQNGKLVMNLGYSNPVEIIPEAGVTVTVPTQTEIVVEGIDKERVGEVAAVIRSKRKPEPYKGKGIRYKGEKIIRKAGKATGKK